MLTWGCGAKPGVVASAEGFFGRSTIVMIAGKISWSTVRMRSFVWRRIRWGADDVEGGDQLSSSICGCGCLYVFRTPRASEGIGTAETMDALRRRGDD